MTVPNDRLASTLTQSAAGIECWDGRLEYAALFELFQERAVLVIEDDAGGGLEKNTIVIRDLLETANENAAGFIEHLRFAAGCDQRGNLILQILAVNRNVLVQNHQLDRQTFRAPVGMRLNELAHEFNILQVGDAQKDQRRVARDTVGPEGALAAAVLQQNA